MSTPFSGLFSRKELCPKFHQIFSRNNLPIEWVFAPSIHISSVMTDRQKDKVLEPSLCPAALATFSYKDDLEKNRNFLQMNIFWREEQFNLRTYERTQLMAQTNSSLPSDFIREIIDEHIRTIGFGGRVATRFPPEPNGYLPHRTCQVGLPQFWYCCSMAGPVIYDGWYGSEWGIPWICWIDYQRCPLAGVRLEDRLFYASDYFEKLYQFAIQLIKVG